ncbi:MAG: hypothetical protein COZ49_03645 [Candidatus Yonathbacteria bacterium CG_4_10_14_3_um_filter_47_65]|uniref:RDD domain-containing protein n=2 Tax=Parcubacteria group TaxID=1794811 RepID=A0A2M8D7U3_9BACT|nr:MAG: hypothetical protein AUJ44_00450 [Candidatus Nomurabacteria bacterium CG1_02_47_685]PIP04243.1 MAG: hypothetical protein COX54_00145 [Candidatus Yonathbacteria bacterium CG23_combo_of_CG06-09_8_20_14_all_46_18]PIQ31944.1 MAG: hypothetical protein COW61_02810 [Candidatus Yonathbacteria bacterium CG17_big_fil_post_rev_8_21_14_2_50_46_19]PIX56152.1 MAG: hypothetical protein COZ49_03645 [Candidatus Yonathbacteria bacterium CG_4_10_14_3_um_filter_47_65]PIY57996.1 MAG: hypothetical protein CO
MEQEQNYQAGAYQQPPVSGVAATNIKYAGFWIRYVAIFIDSLVVTIAVFILGKILLMVVAQSSETFPVSSFLPLIPLLHLGLLWLYFVLMTKHYQATLGKKAVGIRVVSDKSAGLSWGQLILRETVGKMLSGLLFLIGYIMAGFTARKQALHDKIAGTAVVYDNPNKKTPVWVFIVGIFVALLPLMVMVIVGIFASIVLSSLNYAREKSQDVGIKMTLSEMTTDAILYKDANAFYTGYQPRGRSGVACSGQPVIHISDDGNQMAIFMKSCTDAGKYFCVNPKIEDGIPPAVVVDADQVERGATTCASSD